MGDRRGQGLAPAEATERQHSATICGGRSATAVTGWGIHDNVIVLFFRCRFFTVRHSDSSTNDAPGLNDLMKMVVTLEVARKWR
jgi:hypothetical protein